MGSARRSTDLATQTRDRQNVRLRTAPPPTCRTPRERLGYVHALSKLTRVAGGASWRPNADREAERAPALYPFAHAGIGRAPLVRRDEGRPRLQVEGVLHLVERGGHARFLHARMDKEQELFLLLGQHWASRMLRRRLALTWTKHERTLAVRVAFCKWGAVPSEVGRSVGHVSVWQDQSIFLLNPFVKRVKRREAILTLK